MHRTGSLVVAGVVALGLAACSGGSSKSGGTTTTRTPPSITSVVPATSATSAAPATSLAPGQTATSVASGAATTAAGRVVTSPSGNVHLGDSGSGVKQIQTALVAHGFKVSVDGQFGAQTAQAVKSFQQQNGLAQDGVVGPATWAKLQAAASPTTTVKGNTTTAKGSTSTTAKTTTTASH